ncbi:right-handed parallel beta-helix repeat-containing protein [Stieleria sp. ICT_E10.1]|nr:right-handed parallel beta-helix repeat-containing protein [Stieleria sedimenti]
MEFGTNWPTVCNVYLQGLYNITMRHVTLLLLAAAAAQTTIAATIHVPLHHGTIQAAIDAAEPGDTIRVAPGTYQEQIRLKPGITIRSDGDNREGTDGLKRTEATIIDGGSESGDQPGVMMAEASTLDGFTVTHVGVYDEALWKQHFDSKGEELGDAEGSVQAEGTRPAISIQGVSCTVTHCIVHHNGDVGIGVLGKGGTTTAPHITDNFVFRNMGGGIGVADGAEPIIRNNTCKENLRAGIGCRKANPIIINNLSFQNIRAGIGCREGSKPLIRGNKCFLNRRAGIGIRMRDTAPVVENNDCYENEMAGIGCRDGASPILRYNICSKNKMAGIGCRDGAAPLIVGNECRQNELAGIGVQHQASAILRENTCVDNKLVAVGVTAESSAVITGNDFSRVGGLPPIIAVKEDSTATIGHNRITGGGVAAILVQGRATITGNTFTGIGAAQGNAVWVWANSTAAISDNSFNGYRTAVNATKATVTITGNQVSQFQGAAFVVKESPASAHVYGNTALSDDPDANLIDLQDASGTVEQNVLKK